MMNRVLAASCLILVQLALLPVAALCAEATEVEFAEAISSEGTILFLGSAVLLPLVEDGPQGASQALRTADAIASAALAAEVLKELTNEARPDGQGHDSFPSQHAATAFAAATMAAERNPEDALYWYGGAALISWSRVRINRHRPREVIAGALLGYGLARFELELPRGMLMSPFVNPGGDGAGVELLLNF